MRAHLEAAARAISPELEMYRGCIVKLSVDVDGIRVSVFGKHSSSHHVVSYEQLEREEGDQAILSVMKTGAKCVS